MDFELENLDDALQLPRREQMDGGKSRKTFPEEFNRIYYDFPFLYVEISLNSAGWPPVPVVFFEKER